MVTNDIEGQFSGPIVDGCASGTITKPEVARLSVDIRLDAVVNVTIVC